ncbi:MAG: hypothetical protein ACREAM_16195, partial [Blastocatellia bacterium]
GQKAESTLEAMRTQGVRYFERARDISPLSRYLVTPPGAGREVTALSEKIYSSFLNELEESTTGTRQFRPGNCL